MFGASSANADLVVEAVESRDRDAALVVHRVSFFLLKVCLAWWYPLTFKVHSNACRS